MRDDDPELLDRLEADLAGVEHAIERLERAATDTDGHAVGAGDTAGRIRAVLEVPPFLEVPTSPEVPDAPVQS